MWLFWGRYRYIGNSWTDNLYLQPGFFQGKCYVPGMDLQGSDFSILGTRISLDSRYRIIIFADCRDPIFNYKDPNQVPRTP